MTYFFFYGIFKHGGYYARKFVGCEQLGPAKAPGFVILRNTGPAAMVPGKSYSSDDTVAKGTVTGVLDDQLADMLEFLDKVESNGRGYIRVKIEAELDSGRIVEAYTYLWMDYYSMQSDEISRTGKWCGGFTGFRHVHK